MKKLSLLSFFVFAWISGFAADFYWVGNGGNWSDFASHWATSSNGSTMHTRVPTVGDVVFFDQYSFSASDTSQVVVVDTTFIACSSMHWQNVQNIPEFLSSAFDTLFISNQLNLATSSEMVFNFLGKIFFQQSIANQNLAFNPANQIIKADVWININDGTLSVSTNLIMPSKRLFLYDGELNLNNHNLYVQHFNASQIANIPAVIDNPIFSNSDTVVCFGSLHFLDNINLDNFSGVLDFKANFSDSNFISFGTHVLNSELIFSSGKQYFLGSNIHTAKSLNFPMNGQFFTQNFNIYCTSFKSIDPYNRTISLGSSKLHVKEFFLESTGLTFNSSLATLNFAGLGGYHFNTNKPDLKFNSLSVLQPYVLEWNGKIDVDTLDLIAGSIIYFAESSMINLLYLNANGNCGSYIELRAVCDLANQNTDECLTILPVFKSINPVTANYVKISNLKADGSFTLTNSFDEGGNEGWMVSEPNLQSTLYWIGNQGDWNVSDNWSASSGGAPQNCIPTKFTHVVFDHNSFVANDTLSLNEYGYCASMSWINLNNNVVFNGKGNLFVTDSILLNNHMKADFSGKIFLENENMNDSLSITTAGVKINASIAIDGLAQWNFIDTVTIKNELLLRKGKLKFSGKKIAVDNLISKTNELRTIDIENTSVDLTGDGIVWDLNPTNLSFDASGSQMSISGTSSTVKIFNGAGQIYDEVNCISNFVKLNGGNKFKLLKIDAGNTVNFESGTTSQIDSMGAISSCTQRISLVSDLFDSPARLVKTGHDTLSLSNLFITNIVADTTGSKYYEATQTISSGRVDGWIFSAPTVGQTYHWIGATKEWNTLSNWRVNNNPATCLPTILDTVVIDSVHFSTTITDTILIDKNAFCLSFLTEENLSKRLYVQLSQNLYIAESILLSDSVNFEYYVKPSYANIDDYDYGVIATPNSTNGYLHLSTENFNVNLFVASSHITDTVFLKTNLNMDSISGLFVKSGHFVANNKNIKCGFFSSISTSNKVVDLKGANVNISMDLDFQEFPLLHLNADSSFISFLGNSEYFSNFVGGGQTYFDVMINGATNNLENDLLVFVSGANTFHIFKALNGVNLFVEAGKTQTIDSTLIIRGTCENNLTLQSSIPNIACNFVNNSIHIDTITCVKIQDCDISPAGVAMLSIDNGNNSGWTFNSPLAASASFDLPYPACLSTNLVFNNTSVSMWGGTNNLVFEWTIVDHDTNNSENLQYLFLNPGDYTIKLKATDTITGCFDVLSKNLEIKDHSINLSSNIPNLTFCEGSPITFSASSDVATVFEFYLNNVWVDLGDSTINQFTSSVLQNNDSVQVLAIYNGCANSSNTLKVSVSPAPIVHLACSDLDTTICNQDSISFIATGGSFYEFFVDGITTGPFGINNVFSSNTLNHGQVVTVSAKSEVGCVSSSVDSFAVTVVPNPTVVLSSTIDPPIICAGDTFIVNSSGADFYQFYVNGINQGAISNISNFSTASLVDGSVISVRGLNSNLCSSYGNSVEVTVNPSPNTILTSNQPDLEICTGENVVFNGTGATEYQFFIDNIPQSAFSTIGSWSTSSLTHQQSVSLVGRIGNCYDTATTIIEIDVYPKIELFSSGNVICPGQSVTFTATGDTVYQFFVDNVAVTSFGSNNVYASSTLTNGQQVSVQGTTGGCPPIPISVVVNPNPILVFSCSEQDNTICNGDSIAFTASGANAYEFFIDGISQGVPSANTTLSTNALSSGQTITVSGYSGFGCSAVSSNSYTITVHDNPTVSLVSSELDDQICENTAIVFTASGADNYQFLISEVAQGTLSSDSIFNFPMITNGAIYSVQGERNGCFSLAPESYSYTVFNLPNVNLEPITPISVCEGAQISIRGAGATQYEFFVNNISQGSPSLNDVFQSTNLANNDQITVVGYQNICSQLSDDVITVNVNQIPNVNFTSNIPMNGLCFGDTAEFFASGAMSYQFFVDGDVFGSQSTVNNISIPGIEDNQVVKVIGYNNACSSEIENVIIANVNYLDLEIESNFDQNTLCSGEQITITATGGDIYQFFLNGLSLGVAGTNNSVNIPNITNNQYVMVEATDSETGCTTQSADYYFHVAEIPQIITNSNTQFCQYDSVVLSTTSDDALQWFWNSQAINGATQNSYSAYTGGNYSVSAVSGSNYGVFSSGANAMGQLGNGNNVQSIELNRAVLNTPIKMITAGTDFEIALDESGNLVAWGNNSWGNLGIGTYSSVYTPAQISSMSDVASVCAGHNHVLALMSDSTLMSWGQNISGQLGYGNYASSNFPMNISGINNVIAIAAGKNHSLALTSFGNVYAWGLNSFGQLGIGNLNNVNVPTLIPGLDSVVFITAGADHSFAIRADGSLWAWGCNENGQLGTNSINSEMSPVKVFGLKNITKVAAGTKHSLALNHRGELFSWGNDSEGQLGNGIASNSSVPAKLSLVGVKDIACGHFNSYSIRNDYSLWSWGQNNFGQLGDQTTENKIEPVKLDKYFGIKQVCAGKEFFSALWKNSHTCSSIGVTITMDSVPEVVITKTGMTLTCTEGQSYQWFLDGVLLNNAIYQSIDIIAQGAYTVEVFFENGCSAMSDQYVYFLNVEDWFSENNIQVSPNPNNGNFDLKMDMPSSVLAEIRSYSLINIVGSIIASNSNFYANTNQFLTFPKLAPGAYYLVLNAENKSLKVKIFISQ